MRPDTTAEIVTKESLAAAGRLISAARFPPKGRHDLAEAIGRLEQAKANIDAALAACRAENERASDG